MSGNVSEVEIVVARYNENIDWTYEFENVYIYDKSNDKTLAKVHFKGIYFPGKQLLGIVKVRGAGVDDILSEVDCLGIFVCYFNSLVSFEDASDRFKRFLKYKPRIYPLPNVGRESHTYIYHILSFCEKSTFACDGAGVDDGAIVFLQGHPFDHSPNIIQNLRSYLKDWKRLLGESGRGKFAYLGETLHVTNLWTTPDHRRIRGPMHNIYTSIFECEEKDIPRSNLEFYNGAQFIVSKNTILSRNIEFYHKMINFVCSDINPKAGFVFERLWGIIFK